MDKSIQHLGSLAVANALSEKTPSLRDRSVDSAQERRKVAREFTSFLYLEVLKAMRATLPQGGFTESESLSRDIYTSMLDAEIARAMAKRDNSGFVETVEKALEKPPAAKSPGEPLRFPAAAGTVSSIFGLRADPLSGARRFHQGVDIAAPAGTAVKAAAAGKVTFSGWLDGYGNVVDVDHGNGLVSRYGHNAQNLVREGEPIEAGQAIALVGSTGRATGAHVHFELRKRGKPVNPEMLLGSLAKGAKIRFIA
jgi:murein DD-endopeptidase MepM/ murein hydrolase activator NlpD